jgi:hypothetical protein
VGDDLMDVSSFIYKDDVCTECWSESDAMDQLYEIGWPKIGGVSLTKEQLDLHGKLWAGMTTGKVMGFVYDDYSYTLCLKHFREFSEAVIESLETQEKP